MRLIVLLRDPTLEEQLRRIVPRVVGELRLESVFVTSLESLARASRMHPLSVALIEYTGWTEQFRSNVVTLRHYAPQCHILAMNARERFTRKEAAALHDAGVDGLLDEADCASPAALAAAIDGATTSMATTCVLRFLRQNLASVLFECSRIPLNATQYSESEQAARLRRAERLAALRRCLGRTAPVTPEVFDLTVRLMLLVFLVEITTLPPSHLSMLAAFPSSGDARNSLRNYTGLTFRELRSLAGRERAKQLLLPIARGEKPPLRRGGRAGH